MNRLHLKRHRERGLLLVFEGTDGAGKSTLAALARDFLIRRGMAPEDVLTVKQPTEMSRRTKLFQKMMYCRENADIDYRAVQLLTMSDRIQHAHEVILPALREGRAVVCDRYVYTSLANMLARGYCREKWFFDAAGHLPGPDAAFLALVPPEKAIERIRSRPEECARHLNEELLYRVAGEFRNMCRTEGLQPVDTLRPAELAAAEVCKVIDRLIEEKK